MSFKGEQLENNPNMPEEGASLELGSSLEAIGNLSDGEKLAMVKAALCSGDHLLKVVLRIALIVNPDHCTELINSLRPFSSQSPSS